MSSSSLIGRARGYLADAARGIERAPVEVALALWISVTFSFALETGDDAMQAWVEGAVAAALVLVFAWTGTLLHALGTWRARTRWLVTLAGTLLVAAYAYFTLDFRFQAEGWRAAALLAAGVLWLVAVPALGARLAPGPVRSEEDPVATMRRIDGRILLRLLAVLLYAAALYAGLALALAAINALFELHLDAEIYGHVFGWIFFVLVPWVVFGGLDDYVRPAGTAEPVARAVHRLTLYLVPPLLALYLLILYAYVVRIAITGEVPKNLVSPMVLAAGALTALALLLFDPQPAASRFARALRLAPPLLLPLVPLGVWALMLRIEQYGWTEFRALRIILLAAFTALALGGTLQLWRRRAFALHAIPIALAAAALLAVVGPWGVLPLARRSQQARLESALARIDAIPPDTVRRRTVPGELYDRVQSDARYLHAHFGREALPPRLRSLVGDAERWADYAGALGLLRAPSAAGPEQWIHRRLPGDVAIPLRSGSAFRIEYHHEAVRQPNAVSRVTADSLRLVLHLTDRVLTADFAPLLALEAGSASRGELPPILGTVEVRDLAGTVRGELVVLELTSSAPAGHRTITALSGVLLLDE